jgi:hypothetical protein
VVDVDTEARFSIEYEDDDAGKAMSSEKTRQIDVAG